MGNCLQCKMKRIKVPMPSQLSYGSCCCTAIKILQWPGGGGGGGVITSLGETASYLQCLEWGNKILRGEGGLNQFRLTLRTVHI